MQGRFIQSQHPKASISPAPDWVRRTLNNGWIAQPKLDGHRLQVHIGPTGQLICYTRHGSIHTTPLSTELRTGFKAYASEDGWITLEGEWIKARNEVHLFDILQNKSDTLNLLSYEKRYRLLLDLYRLSPHIRLIRVLKDPEACMQVLEGQDPQVEGLVFKAWKTSGWDDTGIVRCLKKGLRR